MSICVLVTFVYDLLVDLMRMKTSRRSHKQMFTVFSRRHKEEGKR